MAKSLGEPFMRWLLELAVRGDARQAARTLLRAPGYTTVTMLTLAIGLGGGGIVAALALSALRPLPYPDPDELVSVWETRDGQRTSVAPANYLDWRRMATRFDGLAASDTRGVSVTVDGVASRAVVAVVSGNLFDVLDVGAALGRTFDPRLDVSFAGREAVLGYAAWRDMFGASPSVLGRTFQVDEITYEVVGVAPPGTDYPEPGLFAWLRSTTEAPEIAGFSSLATLPQMRDAWYFQVLGRLSDETSLETAREEMATLARALEESFPETNEGHGALVVPLIDETVAELGPMLLVLGLAVGLVLLAAAVNVGHLVLARSVARETDAAVRISLGASARDVVRPWLWEGALIGSGGGLLAIVMARITLAALSAWLADWLPRAAEAALTVPVAGVTLALGVLLGITMAAGAGRLTARIAHPFRTLRAAGPIGGRANAFVTAQVAAAIALLGGAGLLARSVENLGAVDPGFETADLITLRVALPDARTRPYGERVQSYETLLASLATIPGVIDAGFGSSSPLTMGPQAGVRVVGLEAERPSAGWQPVSPSFLTALGVSLLRGRTFTNADTEAALQVGVVNETFARTVLEVSDPVGMQVTMGLDGHDRPVTIVGMIADTRTRGPATAPGPVLYRPAAQTFRHSAAEMFFAIRTASTTVTPDAITATVRRTAPGLPIYSFADGERLTQPFRRTQSALLAVIGVFAATALLLGLVGVYGVASHSVQRRRREIGVRLALGARGSRVVTDVVGAGLRQAAFGVPIGVAITLGMARMLEGVLFGVAPFDPLTLALVTGGVLSATTAALLVPAVRAARTDPATATRGD